MALLALAQPEICPIVQLDTSYNSVYSACRPRSPKTGTKVTEAMRPQSACFLCIRLLFAFFSLLLPLCTFAQTALVPSRITQAVDESNLAVLKGNTYYLASAEYDRGAAPASLPMSRMLLVLQRSPSQEAALEQLLDQQQDHSSPDYHQWLTPQQFGQQFGPSDQDIQIITAWLQSHGFQVAPPSNGRTVIEFSGTAGQVQAAFHTTIHKYSVPTAAGTLEDHWANSTNPSIPTALAPVIVGIDTLHNFPRKPMHVLSGVFKKNKTTGEIKALHSDLTFTCGTNQEGQPVSCFGLGPYDFATIYNVLPLWNGSPAPVIDGTGQTIAIIGETDVDVKDIENFRSLFGLPANDPVVVMDGPDPGIVPGDETESDLDLEWAGAVAKGATIKFVTSATTNTTLGVDLSAQFAVDNNVAPVMSESYGICEAALGTAGNQFYNSVWQQAAAQGITAFVSAGDSGSAGCDGHDNPSPAPAEFGLQVNGFASTPYNVAVGGTDFNDLSNPATYWSSTNNATTQLSAKSYIPEVPWNDSCTSPALEFFGFAGNALNNCNNPQLLSVNVFTVGGSGGRSSCTTGDGQDITSCSGGYAKPSWQTGTGVPSDGKRDIPDVSLFASGGFYSGSFYIVCEADQTDGTYCDQNPDAEEFLAVGGTSASTPSFAGIMAMVNQKTASRQGNANYTLYRLAAQSGASCTSSGTPPSTCIFHDITTGSNAMPCDDTVPVPVNCSAAGAAGIGILTGYNSTAGYDLTTGLGSVNAANLVNKWSTITSALKPSATILSLNPTSSIPHGSSVAVQINVTPTPPAAGTATGTVALLSTSAIDPSVTSFALASGSVNTTTDMLPGGSYTVTAHYPGDGTFAASDSTPVSVTVTPESSKTQAAIVTFSPTNGVVTNSNATSFTYGSFYILRSSVTNASGNLCAPSGALQYDCPTGTVALKDTFNGATSPLDAGSYALNSNGYAEDQAIFLLGGQHSIVASYGGDPSYTASNNSSTPDVVTVTKAPTTISLLSSSGGIVGLGSFATLTATIGTQVFLPPLAPGSEYPADNVQFLLGSTPIAGQITYITTPSPSGTAQVIAELGTDSLPVGNSTITAQFLGDGNYSASPVSNSVTVDVLIPTTTAVTTSNPTTQRGSSVTLTAMVTPSQAGPAMTGTIQFWVNCVGCTSIGSAAVVNGRGQLVTSMLPAGILTVIASYNGDTNYGNSSGAVSETVNLIGTTTVVSSSSNSSQQGSNVTFTATVTPAQAGGPAISGNVVFTLNSSYNIGSPAVVNGQGQLATSTLPPGSDTISAQYNGDANYAASTSAGVLGVNVTPGPDFKISFAPSTVNVSAPGANATTVLTVTASNGYNGVINFSSASCSGLPSESSCSFSPASVTGSGTTTLTISTTAPSSLVPLSRQIDLGRWRTPRGAIRFLLLAVALFALGIQSRRHRWNFAGAALLLTLLIANAACGGGGGGGGSTVPTNPGTPVNGNQPVNVTANSGAITHTFTFTLNVN
jgi:subtilase family serine protease